MQSTYSDSDKAQAVLTLESIKKVILQLIEWNTDINSSDDFYGSLQGSQLLAADCTLITAIGEGINRINRVMPGYLHSRFPDIPWYAIIGMRNHIAHGYFEIDAEIVYETVKNDIPDLLGTIEQLITDLT
ncbi:MAG: DUF86 domain-containing protein [Duncaniella sp.]|nr:DUF86 domain-containing protein [Duncaniella sp.]